ncbi:MAG: hypothetical protein Q9167_003044 [Letrouitia subvulpina]
MVNYEHGNFSVAQAKFDNSTKSNIVPLPGRKSTTVTNSVTESSAAASPSSTSNHGGLSRGAKIGIAIGAAAGAVILLVFALCLWRWRQSKRRRPEPTVDKSQIQYVFEKQELDGSAFIRPWPVHLDDKKEDLTNIEVQELPDEPLVEMMTSPQKNQSSRKSGTKMSRSRSYTAYVNVKKAKENRMSNGKVSPPLSKFCSLTCAPFGDRFIDLNRSLPPTPIATPMARSPRVSGTSSPMPKNRRMLWQTRPHSNTLIVPKEMI